MSFEFLAPDATVMFENVRPSPRSPIDWMHREAGARFDERDGCRVTTRYGTGDEEAAICRDSVGIADLFFLGKLELQGAPEFVAATVAELGGSAALAPGLASRHDRVWWCPISASRVLAVSLPDRTVRLREELEAAAAGTRFASVIELTTALGSNAVVGPLAREAFARTTALDLRGDRFVAGAFAPVSVARTPGMVLRDGEDRFLHLFGSGFAQYTWTVFVDAAEHLGGGPVGLDAIGNGGLSDA